MNIGVFHHLPTGGALRVLGEWVRLTEHKVTVYTPDSSVHGFARFPDTVETVVTHMPGPFEGIGVAKAILFSGRASRAVATLIDDARHDAAFVLPSRLTQTPTILRFLATPSVYYAPEALRLAYEDPALVFLGDDWKIRLTRAGGNPIEHLRKHVDRRAMRACRRIVTHSEFTRDDLRRNYDVDSTVVRLGVDADAFARPSAPPRRTDPFVLSVGALHPLKGHDLVIDAVASMDPPRPRVVVVGDRGNEAQALRNRALDVGVSLEIHENLPFPELVSLFHAASAVACAQVREPFGLVPLEAMAAEAPVVAVNEGGLKESVIDNVTGLLVPRDARQMGDAITRLLRDADLRTRLGSAGRSHVLKSWRWDTYAQRIDEILAEEATRGSRR